MFDVTNASNVEVDVTTSCRTCMRRSEALVKLSQPLKLEEQSLALAAVLMECVAVQVSEDDGLPQNVCMDCVKLLEISYTFRKQVLKAENEFKTLILLPSTVKTEVAFKPENDFDDYPEAYDDTLFESAVPKQESEEIYECGECKKQYTKEKRLIKHLAAHQAAKFSCTVCSKSFQKQSSLDKHVSKHYEEQFKCVLCSVRFDRESLLLEHMVAHANGVQVKTESGDEFQYKCESCDAVYSSHRSLAMHKKKHKDKEIKSFVCDFCGKDFGLKTLLRRHLKLHSSERPYHCVRCPKKYSRHDQLIEHMNRHDGIRSYSCQYCNKAFVQLCNLKDHERTHTGETPYLCSQCGKGFSNGSNLRQHMMRHTGLKPYSCGLCPKTFTTKGQMTSHMSTHSGAHPYTCEACGAAFTKPNSLKKHKYIHLAVRPFACDSCTMRFTCKDHLKRHQRTHTGEKPYACASCERAFSQSNDLVKHARTHHGADIYRCTICDMRFRLKGELKQHYPTHYVNGEPPAAGAHAGLPPQPPPRNPKPPAAEDVKTSSDPGNTDEVERMITITFNGNVLDGSGLAGDITISLVNEGEKRGEDKH